jgi:hypothetical protein
MRYRLDRFSDAGLVSGDFDPNPLACRRASRSSPVRRSRETAVDSISNADVNIFTNTIKGLKLPVRCVISSINLAGNVPFHLDE